MDNSIDLHRLIWSPDDLDEGGKLLPSAFRREDLKGIVNGVAKYVSVSRVDIINPAFEIKNAGHQASRADGVHIVREIAWSFLFNVGDIRNAKDGDNIEPFCVTVEPEEENLAHCGIHNRSGKNGKGYINRLRAMLCTISHSGRPLSEFIESL